MGNKQNNQSTHLVNDNDQILVETLNEVKNAHDDWLELVDNKDRTLEKVQSRTGELAQTYSLEEATFYTVMRPNIKMTPLKLASYFGRSDVAEALIEAKADVNSECNNWTPLQAASARGHLPIVKLLVEKEADINKGNRLDITPIHYAAYGGHLNIVLYLHEEKKVSVNQSDKDNKTLLYYAARMNHLNVAEYLLQNQVNIDMAENFYNQTPLYSAAGNSYTDMVSLLVQAKADVNIMADSPNYSYLNPLISCLGRMVREIEDYSQRMLDDAVYNSAKIQALKNVITSLLSSPEYPLYIRTNKEKALVLKVLQESPTFVPFKSPLINRELSKGYLFSADEDIDFIADDDISAQIRKTTTSYVHEALTSIEDLFDDLNLFGALFHFTIGGGEANHIYNAISSFKGHTLPLKASAKVAEDEITPTTEVNQAAIDPYNMSPEAVRLNGEVAE